MMIKSVAAVAALFVAVASGSEILEALADSYVRGGTYANQNYGSSTFLKVKNSNDDSWSRATVIKFDLSGTVFPIVKAAALRLFVSSMGSDLSRTVTVKRLRSPTWEESLVTWNNLDVGVAEEGNKVEITTSHQSSWIELDVTDLLDDGSETLNLMLSIDGASAEHGWVMFSSREGFAAPQLVAPECEGLDTDPDKCMVVEEIPDMSEGEIKQVMDWIKAEVTVLRSPFCWKNSYGRGAGAIPTECPGRDKIGALCYSKCPPGYTRFGVDCHQTCPAGFRDDGLYCRKLEYGRGGGYAFWDWNLCESHHGMGNCEWWGAMIYPKCDSGYFPAGCCICSPHVDCAGFNHQIGNSCAKNIIIGDPVPMSCGTHLEYDAGLCYQRCVDKFYGVGPVCWGECQSSATECGAACALSSTECASNIVGMVIAPIILAANIATMGLAGTAAAAGGATKSVKIYSVTSSGVKSTTRTVFYPTSKVSRALVNAVDTIQTIKPASAGKNANVVKRYFHALGGDRSNRVMTLFNAYSVDYFAVEDYSNAYADDFSQQTSPYINGMLDANYHPNTAKYLKTRWAKIALAEMSEANDWGIAGMVLDLVAVVDVTGITGVVAAYAKPVCMTSIAFPCIEGRTTPC